MSDSKLSNKNVHAIDLHVSKKLKMRRLISGLSQNVLGEAVDVSIQQIQKYEKGINRISSGKLYAFAKLLKVPVSYFFEGSNKSEGESLSYVAEEDEEYKTSSEYRQPNDINEKEILGIIKVFSEIKDASIRRKIFELIKTLTS